MPDLTPPRPAGAKEMVSMRRGTASHDTYIYIYIDMIYIYIYTEEKMENDIYIYRHDGILSRSPTHSEIVQSGSTANVRTT